MKLLSIKLSTLAFILPFLVVAQSFSIELAEKYPTYLEKTINSRRFKHSDIEKLIKKLPDAFIVEEAGRSIEGRPIYLVKIGSGKTKVLLWSQMHGDEPTATMAIMDIFNFFNKTDQFDTNRANILEALTLYFIPLLNPDGSEKFSRRNTLHIDLNRDALRLQTPEGQLLKKIRDVISADWGFNLHDQSRYYSVGNSNKTATISFLAPAFNFEKDINPIRKNAMQQIGLMNDVLQQFMPGHVAKYNDDFEPRAFGDNIQKWGTRTILIESGGYKDDPEKQFIRKMNFIALMAAFDQIANKKYVDQSTQTYENIPFNGRYFHELLIRNATIVQGGSSYIIDLGFRKDEIQFNKNRSFYSQSYISDLGDLSTFFGYEELDAIGYTIIPGKLYPKTMKDWRRFKKLNLTKLHQQGYTDIKIKNLKDHERKMALPIKLIPEYGLFRSTFSPGNNPSFFLEKNGHKEYLIANGTIFKLSK